MANHDWDESLKLELIRLKSELSPQSIKPAASGFGFGSFLPREGADDRHEAKQQSIESENAALREQVRKLSQKKNYAPISEPTSAKVHGQQVAHDLAVGSQCETLEQVATIGKNHLFYKFLKSYFIDIVFVIGTLVVVLLGVGLVFDGHHMVWNWEGLLHWLPVRYLLEASWLAVGGGFLLLFLVYRLFFKIIAGHTLGESLTGYGAEQSGKSNSL